MKTKKLLGSVAVMAVTFIMMCFALIELYDGPKHWVYPICGVLGMLIVGICVIRGSLWSYYDAIIFSAFLCLSMISSLLWGIDPLEFLFSRFFSFWMICLSMYYVIQNYSDSKRYLEIFFFFAALIMCFISFYVVIHASSSIIRGVINQDEMKGCFSGGRLFAIGNANTMGVASAGHILISLAGLLNNPKKNKALRIFYIFSTFVGWIVLGLTGCRTGRIGLAAALSIFAFVMIRERMAGKGALFAGLISLVIFMAILVSFVLPGLIYKGVMMAIGYLFSIDNLKGFKDIKIHKILDDDGTMSGRTEIWLEVLRTSTKNAKRFFFGISPLGTEQIHDVYAGHHEIKTIHAHNTYLEIFRKHGFLGFAALMAFVTGWFVNSIKLLFSKTKDSYTIFVMLITFAVLLMGIAEPLPFVSAYECFIVLPFFMSCGYCIKVGRSLK